MISSRQFTKYSDSPTDSNEYDLELLLSPIIMMIVQSGDYTRSITSKTFSRTTTMSDSLPS